MSEINPTRVIALFEEARREKRTGSFVFHFRKGEFMGFDDNAKKSPDDLPMPPLLTKKND